MGYCFQGISAHLKRDATKGVVNNQVLDWSYKLDGIFQNSTQEEVFSTVALNMVKSSLDGFNGKILLHIVCINALNPTPMFQSLGLLPYAGLLGTWLALTVNNLLLNTPVYHSFLLLKRRTSTVTFCALYSISMHPLLCGKLSITTPLHGLSQ